MRYLILSLLFQTFLAHANGSDPRSVISSLESLNSNLNKQEQHNRCAELEPDSFSPHIFIDASIGHTTKHSCESVSGLTNEMRYYNRYFGQYFCKQKFGRTGYNCSEEDGTKIKARANDPILMNRIISFTNKKFEEYKVSLRNECCRGKSQNCHKRFKDLELKIEDSNKAYATYEFTLGHHNLTYNSIKLTHLKLAAEYTHEGIERMLLHEMGHVCHVASVSEKSTNDFNRFAGNSRCEKSVGEEFFHSFDPSLRKCLIKNLDEQIKNNPNTNGQFCYGKWYREAAAEMMFKHRMDSIYHWVKPTYSNNEPTKNNSNIYKLHECVKALFPKDQVCH